MRNGSFFSVQLSKTLFDLSKTKLFSFINYKKSLSTLILITLTILISCKKDKEIKSFEEFKNLSYGSQPRNRLDLFLPKKSFNSPLLIFIHGGGWTEGDKDQVTNILMPFLSKGFAVASLNYSYADSKNTFTQINQDIENAVTYLISHSVKYKYSSANIGMIGYSCGGHSSLLYSYRNKNIKAVASISGLANLCDSIYINTNNLMNSIITQYIGAPYSTSSALWEINSPFVFCNLNRTPTYIVSATGDNIVSCKDAKNLHLRLDSLAIPNIYKEYNDNHELFFHLQDSEWDEMADWFINNLIK